MKRQTRKNDVFDLFGVNFKRIPAEKDPLHFQTADMTMNSIIGGWIRSFNPREKLEIVTNVLVLVFQNVLVLVFVFSLLNIINFLINESFRKYH